VGEHDDARGAIGDDPVAQALAVATSTQVGALGEETAAVLLEEVWEATIVAMGDAGMPRDGASQNLDLLAFVDGELIAYEVKTRYRSKRAGRVTRAGNLLRPRLNRARSEAAGRQGSQSYVGQRVDAFVDTGDGYGGIDVRVIAVDFVAMLAQQFAVNDAATRLTPLDEPVGCADAAAAALHRITEHQLAPDVETGEHPTPTQADRPSASRQQSTTRTLSKNFSKTAKTL
jgi:hypothetical protein